MQLDKKRISLIVVGLGLVAATTAYYFGLITPDQFNHALAWLSQVGK